MRGDYSSSPAKVAAPAPSQEPSGHRLSEAIAEFVAEHDASGHWRKKSREESEGIYRLLVGILGDVPMAELDYKALSGWRDALLRFPSNYTKRPALRGKTIAEIASMDSDATKPHLSATSVNKMLTQTGAFLKWSVKRGYCGANYCEGLTIKRRGVKAEEEREAYSEEDLLRLIRSPLYAEPKTAKDLRDRLDHPERQWLPLLGLYSGARLNELCQLEAADIREEDGILCIDINDKGEGKRLKNAASRRVIPVHPFLLELGFGGYVGSMRGRRKKAERLWPALKLKRDGWAQDYGKLYQRFNRKFVTTNPKRVFHSFRHNVADTLKQKGVDGNVIAELLGHSLGGSMSLGRYGKAYRPAVLLEALGKLEYGIEGELKNLK
jgi:integrase